MTRLDDDEGGQNETPGKRNLLPLPLPLPRSFPFYFFARWRMIWMQMKTLMLLRRDL